VPPYLRLAVRTIHVMSQLEGVSLIRACPPHLRWLVDCASLYTFTYERFASSRRVLNYTSVSATPRVAGGLPELLRMYTRVSHVTTIRYFTDTSVSAAPRAAGELPEPLRIYIRVSHVTTVRHFTDMRVMAASMKARECSIRVKYPVWVK